MSGTRHRHTISSLDSLQHLRNTSYASHTLRLFIASWSNSLFALFIPFAYWFYISHVDCVAYILHTLSVAISFYTGGNCQCITVWQQTVTFSNNATINICLDALPYCIFYRFFILPANWLSYVLHKLDKALPWKTNSNYKTV